MHCTARKIAALALVASDVIGADVVPFRQEFLSQMLGVRLTATARTLQSAGMIHYARGRVEISDREKLEKSACECYEILRSQPAQILFRPKR
jgi:hypothetical protein